MVRLGCPLSTVTLDLGLRHLGQVCLSGPARHGDSPPPQSHAVLCAAHTSEMGVMFHLPEGVAPTYVTWNSSAWETCLSSAPVY